MYCDINCRKYFKSLLTRIKDEVTRESYNVYVQDQTTPPFHRYFMTEDKTDITLTSAISKDDVVAKVQDDLSVGTRGLVEFRIVATGQLTLNE